MGTAVTVQSRLSNASVHRALGARGRMPLAFAGVAGAYVCGLALAAFAATMISATFARVNGAAAVPGTGIGLAPVAQFAALQGGRAWIEDRPGGGASFRVSLPLCQ